MKIALYSAENVRKGENAGCRYFPLLLQCFKTGFFPSGTAKINNVSSSNIVQSKL